MEELMDQGGGDRHLNLFYTYDTPHLENNVTRALVITLRNLAPVHLRLFLRDVVLRRPAQAALRERLQVVAEGGFDFGLQVAPPDEDRDRLGPENGVIVGVNYSGTQAPRFEGMVDVLGGARPDALVQDTPNEVTAIFEIKLSDSLYREQIQRHFQWFFAPGSASLDQVFVEITWNEIAEFLQRVARQSVGERERFVVGQFVQYLDWLKLVDFLGFRAGDFAPGEDGRFNEWKLDKFLVRLASSLGSELGVRDYGGRKLSFQDVPHENIWFEMGPDGVSCGIVCGSGKMWRAQRLRDYVVAKPADFRKLVERLRATVDSTFPIVLRMHSYFRYSRFRTAWLGDIGGVKVYPEDYDAFVATLGDRQLNAFDRIPKSVIQERFAADIERNKESWPLPVDGQGQFPKWENIDPFLQYGYFHIDVRIALGRLVGRPLDELFRTFKSVLEAEHELLCALSAI